ncbi:MAG: hypothetical protein HPY57_14615 [Ignavibacteria bacterium]|nr:hypothetical protein [Ignavibacteria bacterium]
MKKYDNYIKENDNIRNENAKKWLLEQPFIKIDEKTGKMLVIAVKYKNFPESLTNISKRKWTELNYTTLVRLLLFSWLFKYNGNSKDLLLIKKQLKENIFDENLRIFTQIPTNISIMKKWFRPISGENLTIYSENYIHLGLILYKKDEIFNETNILDWMNFVRRLTNKANKSENDTIDFIKKNKIYADAIKASDMDDKNGIDIWLINNKGEKIPAQVKYPVSNTNISMFWGKDKKEYKIVIDDTNLDMKNYNVFKDGKLIWKFLFLWDPKKKKLYQINSSSINRIYKHPENNYVYINLRLTDEWLPRMIKIYDISTTNTNSNQI